MKLHSPTSPKNCRTGNLARALHLAGSWLPPHHPQAQHRTPCDRMLTEPTP